ncbi:NDP-hexose 3,5-(Or5-) epimerasee [Streptomyces sp. 2224.1]|uniref:dTDP-4-dehydrorhamnose 3,5-epimerase family protein n=1 Tax=unclassified Streptomyces TaxID=2593676 RepID=UPI00088AC189|nr:MULTISPECIES: dTDP-4-dehydrorhamnose 3,5-epimerase [unclassified Streptomyces]PBC83952.1 NDP-hexose 3,5-(Or5-) epimerasee [Streptomyces sp. 2321.6]SDR36770.1 NDP-hexose 3,5-(Or5-) epimerasee [Streptomyces sp. KS_16]SEB87409.1 NDP-hexose 3,5-(Or5-) epimerasee [Streptomyces sp. 2224.1]SED14677.1 NDP-hexose 3,5-(Or5-) epimerasee [Streptomyces sp. 2133.1]SEE64852.1 NDP-hexose 3,5-(Or5-) epimerasee [Streptomyces sp. 2112.3]
MSIKGAYRLVPNKIPDIRGSFFEAFRGGILTEIIGYPFTVGQANYSLSRRNTMRGIHSTSLPPGQAKLVTCVRGAVLDVAVDLRVGSPTFGMYDMTPQDEESGTAVYMADGIGHAFLALTDDACMNYLCSEAYVPGTMIEVNPLDPDIGIPWGIEEPPIMSEKDAAAPTLAEAVSQGLLPTYEECLAHYQALGKRSAEG